MTADRCMEAEMVAATEGEDTEDNGMLPELTSLELHDLPKLMSSSQRINALNWP